jgi:transposase
VLAYLFHRIEDRLDGSPTLLIIDEGWLALDDEGFAGQLREWLKTLRKKNASVIFATQSLSTSTARRSRPPSSRAARRGSCCRTSARSSRRSPRSIAASASTTARSRSSRGRRPSATTTASRGAATACSSWASAKSRSLRETALSLTASLKQLDTEIEKHASALTGYEGIVSIKGVGPRSAAVLLAAIGNVHDFESADKLAAYFGMVPRVAQSNETDHRGRITKRGNKLARTTLVQCSLVATRYSPYLKNFHERIRQRRGTGKAIIATARKLLSIIYDTLKNGWVFSDFTTFSRIQPAQLGQSS